MIVNPASCRKREYEKWAESPSAQSPGFQPCGTNVATESRPERSPASLQSVPKVSFIKIDPILLQKLEVFLLKSGAFVMFLLVLNILSGNTKV